jgi:hypothetical protein
MVEWLTFFAMLTAGVGPAIPLRRRGISPAIIWTVVLLGETLVAGLAFLSVLTAHDYPAMGNTLGAFLALSGPYLLGLSLLTVAPVLALVRPIVEGERP